MFKHIDILLLLYGAKIYIDSKPIKWLNYSFGAIFIIDTLGSLYRMILIFARKPITDVLPVFIEYLSFMICGLINQYLMVKKRHVIRSMVDRLNRISSQSMRSKQHYLELRLFWLNWISAIFCLLTVTVAFINYVQTQPYHFLNMMYSLVRLLYVGLIREQYLNMSAIPYTYLATSIELVKQDTVRKAIIRSSDDIYRLMVKVRNLNRWKHEFEREFRIFPFLWYSFLFIGATGVLSSNELTTDVTRLESIFYVITFFSHLVVVFYYTYYISEQVAATQEVLESKVSEFEKISQNWSMLNYVGSTLTKDVKYTAIGLFELNSGLILSFASGLISFTVMFLQMSH